VTKAVLLSEVARAVHQLLQQYKRVIGQFAVLQAASAVKMQKIWKGLLDDLALDTDEMAGLAKKTVGGEPMATLAYCQFFPDIPEGGAKMAATAQAFGGSDIDEEFGAAAAPPTLPEDAEEDDTTTEVDL